MKISKFHTPEMSGLHVSYALFCMVGKSRRVIVNQYTFFTNITTAIL